MATSRFKGKESVLVRRALKRARVFEIRKLIRKIRLYDAKKGGDKQLECYKRKKERFIEEMETMKDFDMGEMADNFIREPSIVKDMLDMKQLPSDMKDRAKWRLVNCDSVKQLLLKSINASIQSERSETSEDTADSSGGEGDSISDGEGGEEEEKGSERDSDASSTAEGNLDTEGEADAAPIRITTGSRTPLSQLRNSRKKVTASILGESGRRSMKGMDSLFVSSLAVSKRKRNHVKNRLGQRARQQLWEKKFKEKANHLKTKKDGKRRHHDKSRRQQKGSQRFNTTEKTAHKTTFNNNRTDNHTIEDEGPLHPSWEASRVRKEQQSIKQSFQGSRIVFGDSD